jgi:hypothetical protein
MGDGGKGSSPRPFSVSRDEYDNRFEAIFGRKNKVQVRVQENVDEVGRCGCGRSPTGKCIGWHGLTEEQLKQAQEKWALEESKKSGLEQ